MRALKALTSLLVRLTVMAVVAAALKGIIGVITGRLQGEPAPTITIDEWPDVPAKPAGPTASSL